MGFDCGFNAIKKFKDYTVMDYINTIYYIEWLDNPWNHEEGHYPTYKKYWDSTKSYSKEPYPGEPNEEIIEFYRDNEAKELFSWGSWNFSPIDEDLKYYLEKLDEDGFIYLLKDKDKLIDYLNKLIKDNELEQVTPIKGINYQEDEMILRDIDGVMLECQDRKLKQYDNDNDCAGLCLINDENMYWISYYLNLLKAKLEVIDLDEYWVYYWRSW